MLNIDQSDDEDDEALLEDDLASFRIAFKTLDPITRSGRGRMILPYRSILHATDVAHR
jgi:hypothetical protein